jgi:hypothetical protein
MPNFQQLSNDQINDAIRGAVELRVPIVITYRNDELWMTFYSRFVATDGSHFTIEMPHNEKGGQQTWSPADRIGVSFKYRHYKYVCSATLAGPTTIQDENGDVREVLSVVSPTQMHRLQRRVYKRVSIPSEESVRATVWLGGSDTRPDSNAPESQSWDGFVDNLSAGGFHMFCQYDVDRLPRIGDEVGLRMSFGSNEEPCLADAMIRHVQRLDDGVSLGLQFLGLSQTRHGRATLSRISSKVAYYLKVENGQVPCARSA